MNFLRRLFTTLLSVATHDESNEPEPTTARRRNEQLLLLARSAQSARYQNEQEELRQIAEERAAWDKTIQQIRCIQQQNEFDR